MLRGRLFSGEEQSHRRCPTASLGLESWGAYPRRRLESRGGASLFPTAATADSDTVRRAGDTSECSKSQREDDQRLTCNPRRRLSGVIAPSGVDASAVRTCAGLDGYATATRVCPRLWSLHPTTAGSWSSGQQHTLTGCRVVVSKECITAGDISGGLDVGWIATGRRAEVGQ